MKILTSKHFDLQRLTSKEFDINIIQIINIKIS